MGQRQAGQRRSGTGPSKRDQGPCSAANLHHSHARSTPTCQTLRAAQGHARTSLIRIWAAASACKEAATVWHGMAMAMAMALARPGMALALARPGRALALALALACHGTGWHGTAWHGTARHGMAWQGMAWHGRSRSTGAFLLSCTPRKPNACTPHVGCCMLRRAWRIVDGSYGCTPHAPTPGRQQTRCAP